MVLNEFSYFNAYASGDMYSSFVRRELLLVGIALLAGTEVLQML
jgi:hypothetical protein